MEQPVMEFPVVYWHQLQGNKYNKSLHPAMLNDTGFRRTMKVRLIGKTSLQTEYAVVIYDRDYLISWIANKVIKPVANLGFRGVIKLIIEAYKEMCPHEASTIDKLNKIDV